MEDEFAEEEDHIRLHEILETIEAFMNMGM